MQQSHKHCCNGFDKIKSPGIAGLKLYGKNIFWNYTGNFSTQHQMGGSLCHIEQSNNVYLLSRWKNSFQISIAGLCWRLTVQLPSLPEEAQASSPPPLVGSIDRSHQLQADHPLALLCVFNKHWLFCTKLLWTHQQSCP